MKSRFLCMPKSRLSRYVLAAILLVGLLIAPCSASLAQTAPLYGWGDNYYGQLGDGTNGYSLVPTQTVGLTNVVQIASGASHTLALKSDGTVWAWGSNKFGELGDGSNMERDFPVQVTGLSGVIQIAGGTAHSVALKSDGTVWTWGDNSEGQLGLGKVQETSTPIRVSGLTKVIQITAGSYHTLVIRKGGAVWAWGFNDDGEVGNGTTDNQPTPVQVAGLTSIVKISGGYYHSLAVKSDGTAYGWGSNYTGQLGDGTDTDRSSPVKIYGVTSAVNVAAGGYHSLLLKSDGTVWGTGDNYHGVLGNGTYETTYIVFPCPGVANATQIAAGGAHSLALASDGSVMAWGDNHGGQLGDNMNELTSPIAIFVPNLVGATQVQAGSAYCVALKSDGTVQAWGDNSEGQLGNGGHGKRDVPQMVAGVGDILQVSGGFYHQLVLQLNGTVWAWGNNFAGQIGDGTYLERDAAVKVPGLKNVVQIAGGGLHSLALKSNGTVWAWGDNYYGELGDGGNAQSSAVPVQVQGLTNVVQISSGAFSSFALKSDGTVWAWGDNYFGELGDGGSEYFSNVPVQVAGITGATQVSGGVFHALAIKSDGTAWAWGDNFSGELGDGGDEYYSGIPVQVQGITTAIQISAGYSYSVALLADGSVWAWGDNYNGQLGDGSDEYYSGVPVLVGGLPGAVQIAAGDSHVLALTMDGNVWAWGANFSGQLGDASAEFVSPIPIQVMDLMNQTFIGASGYNSFSTQAVVQSTTVTAPNVTVPFAKSFKLSATLKVGAFGRLLINQPVSFSVHGTLIGVARTNAAGKAIISIGASSNFATGAHAIDVAFVGSGIYSGSQATSTLTVVKADTTLSFTAISGRPGDTKKLVATLRRKSDGAPISGQALTFKIDGNVFATPTTDGTGRVVFQYKFDESYAVGSHTMTVEFAGDADHNASVGSGDLTVNQSPTKVSASSLSGKAGKTVVLKGKLIRLSDKALVIGRTVRFQIEGVDVGSAVSDANGEIKLDYTIPLTLVAGTHAITVLFDGDSFYLSSTETKATLTVK